MRSLLLAGLLLAFATPAFAEGGCTWDKNLTVQAPSSPSTVVEAPQTPATDEKKS